MRAHGSIFLFMGQRLMNAYLALIFMVELTHREYTLAVSHYQVDEVEPSTEKKDGCPGPI